jgi:hypothetical protein
MKTSSFLPLSLSDEHMQIVMLGVASLPTEKRHLFLRRVASLLRFRGGRRHGDTDVKIAVRLAKYSESQALFPHYRLLKMR